MTGAFEACIPNKPFCTYPPFQALIPVIATIMQFDDEDLEAINKAHQQQQQSRWLSKVGLNCLLTCGFERAFLVIERLTFAFFPGSFLFSS